MKKFSDHIKESFRVDSKRLKVLHGYADKILKNKKLRQEYQTYFANRSHISDSEIHKRFLTRKDVLGIDFFMPEVKAIRTYLDKKLK